ncbi:MAG TPA: hypothetical protein VND70_05145 [Acidimicrobiales bacterium]|nr:hypothetical protein [Acidimicrobiales bacterium]
MPDVILRVVNISNGNHAVPLDILTVKEMWITRGRCSPRRLVLSGFLVAPWIDVVPTTS